MTESSSLRPENWEQLTPEKKRIQRLRWWAETTREIKFVSPEAAQSYKTRLRRLIDVFLVREPDRVPANLSFGAAPLYASGIDYHTGIYDYEKAVQACARFNEVHSLALEACAVPKIFPASVFDALDYRLYSWPGHGTPVGAAGYQFNEGEYMRADEYDAFIRDPSDFWMRTYLPRIFGAFEPFRQLGRLTDILEFPTGSLLPLGAPDVQDTLRKLIDAGRELAKFAKITGEFNRGVVENGYLQPPYENTARAPFDTLGDTLRGTKAIMNDMFRRPDKLLEALDATADMTINSIMTSRKAARGFTVNFPLHKGADGWMSPKQFDIFYFPSLKKVMDAFINDGYIVTLFAEGSYDTRLESFADFPRGSVHWKFDRTDIARAKQLYSDKFSMEGNVPTSLIGTGTPGEVKEYCRHLIETCGPGGGYILAAGASMDNPSVENLKAMVEAAREYGTYREHKSCDSDDLFAGAF
jgi:hypothetical protein